MKLSFSLKHPKILSASDMVKTSFMNLDLDPIILKEEKEGVLKIMFSLTISPYTSNSSL